MEKRKFIHAYEFHEDETLCNYLKWLYEVDDIEDIEIFELFEGDPDILRLDGKNSYFLDLNIDGVEYVLYTNEDAEGVLEKFYNGELKPFEPENNSWECFYNQQNALAYRGGMGYFYALYYV